MLWYIDSLLSNDSVNGGLCYVTPATYTHGVFYMVRAATVAVQRCDKLASTIEGLRFLRGP
jgi:hypothetical protein